jgi:hypothetical protein
MQKSKMFFFVIFFYLNCFLCAQNHMSISMINGDTKIKYFPPVKTFANPFYSYQLFESHNYSYVVDVNSLQDKELSFLINGEEINVYLGVNDTVNILFDTASGRYSFLGNNAEINEVYNRESLDRERYKNMFEDFFSSNSNSNGSDKIVYLFTNELDRLNHLFSVNGASNDCIAVYKTSRVISMLFWIGKAYYPSEGFEEILPKLLTLANLEEDKIKNCSRNFIYYQTYYSLRHKDRASNVSDWLSELSYIFHAPEDIKNFMLQTTYIGNYTFAKDSYNWCNVYSELRQFITEIYYEEFFQNHKPCK